MCQSPTLGSRPWAVQPGFTVDALPCSVLGEAPGYCVAGVSWGRGLGLLGLRPPFPASTWLRAPGAELGASCVCSPQLHVALGARAWWVLSRGAGEPL